MHVDQPPAAHRELLRQAAPHSARTSPVLPREVGYARPSTLEEALELLASIDGASGWRMLWFITLPGLKPFILVALVFRTIDALRVFALAWAITKGGPSRASEVAQLYIFNLGIGQYFNMGYASAAATLFALLVGLISGIYLLMMRRAPT